jgi:hypothetical protein
MSRAARSVFIFGVYLAILGLTLAVVPNVLLGLFGLPNAQEPWVRVLGVVTAVVGHYYMAAGLQGDVGFFRSTLPGRSVAFIGFALLSTLRLAPPVLVLLGAVDAAGAVWTWFALRKTDA